MLKPRTLAAILALTLVSATGFAQPPVAVEPVITSGLTFALGMTHAGDGSGRLFVVEQGGRIKVWTGGSSVLPTPFLDLSTIVSQGGEQGLLGLAFHPAYAANGLFYVNYTDLAGDTVVERYQVSAGDPNVADPASAQLVLTFAQTFENHNGGDMHFGPDGFLYISSGDGGGPASNAQDPTNLLGKILRIDVDGSPDAGEETCGLTVNYGIPDDNPLVGGAGDCDEIWSMGLRNPWRFSFDRETGDMWIGDVGEGEWEEVDFEPAGIRRAGGAPINYGWPCYEGNAVFDGCGMPEDFVFPIHVLPHPPNCSVIGGFRYRGQAFPQLVGFYFFSDWCSGRLWAAEPDGVGGWISHDLIDIGAFTFTGFGESDDGELFIAGTGGVVQVVDPSTLFADGFETGDTSGWTSTVGGLQRTE